MSSFAKIKIAVRQLLKTFIQNVLLPVVYWIYRSRPVDPEKVIFADSNSDSMPESMLQMYNKVKKSGYTVSLYLRDIRKSGSWDTLKFMCSFMREYAQAGCVFICNYFVPVNSCKKKASTRVVQLWHSCGLMKKFAYDADEDISRYYKGSVTKNIDLITVSAKACVPVFQNALHLKGKRRSIVKATGVSRTDVFFSEEYNQACREKFYNNFPQWRGKKIILWAPTFRGTAADPRICGENTVLSLSDKLGSDWAVVIKLHPHLDQSLSNCNMSSSELFSCSDVLVTDYSSLIFEYALYRKPFVIFAPDLENYANSRGFYISLDEFPCPIVTDGEKLHVAIKEQERLYAKAPPEIKAEYNAFVNKHCGACDGFSTDRIFDLVLNNK